jgi:hypothetical protein
MPESKERASRQLIQPERVQTNVGMIWDGTMYFIKKLGRKWVEAVQFAKGFFEIKGIFHLEQHLRGDFRGKLWGYAPSVFRSIRR